MTEQEQRRMIASVRDGATRLESPCCRCFRVRAVSHKLKAPVSSWDSDFVLLYDWYREQG